MSPSLWEEIAPHHHHGINLSLSSLHTAKSCGNGEIFDLLPVLDWMKEVGFDVLQLLPLTDSGADSSPYSALSSTALNPIFLSLHALPYREIQLPVFERGHRFPYGSIREAKMAWLMRYLETAADPLRHEEGYTEFLETTPWIFSYGKFVALKEKNEGKPWWEWIVFEVPEEEIKKHILIQYLLDKQLKEVAERARELEIYLIGDSPILMNRDSVECYEYRALFHENLNVGVPPDVFNKDGQAWGFPAFNWPEIHKENYPFLRERLQAAERYFSLFRLDHIIGFFRLWIIPEGKTAIEGYYMPSTEPEYLKQGEYLLRFLQDHTHMLLMGEDLGIISKQVQFIMHTLRIPGMRVMRWEREYERDKSFIPLDIYEPISMTTLSTHDSESLADWWKNYPEEAEAFARTLSIPYENKLSAEERLLCLKASHHTSSIFHINLLQEYLSLENDWSFENPELERINIPGTVSPFNWTFQTLPSVETWTTRSSFNQKIKDLIEPKQS